MNPIPDEPLFTLNGTPYRQVRLGFVPAARESAMQDPEYRLCPNQTRNPFNVVRLEGFARAEDSRYHRRIEALWVRHQSQEVLWELRCPPTQLPHLRSERGQVHPRVLATLGCALLLQAARSWWRQARSGHRARTQVRHTRTQTGRLQS